MLWTQFSEQKLRIFSKVKKELIPICKKIGNNYQYNKKKGMVGCHHLLLIYDAPQLSNVDVVKSPVLGLERAFFQKNQEFFQK